MNVIAVFQLLLDSLGWLLIAAGTFFFVTGALGLLRFPDIFTRLHAVTKTDTAGLGLLVFGLALHSGSLRATLLLVLIWLLVMASGAVTCQLLARYSVDHDAPPQVPESASSSQENARKDGARNA
jgi:multicomponent Na+:H+ antiporter subunit G